MTTSSPTTPSLPVNVTVLSPPNTSFTRWDGISSLRTFKASVIPYFSMRGYDDEKRVLAFLSGEVVRGAPYKIVQRISAQHMDRVESWEAGGKKGSAPADQLTIAEIWEALNETYGGEALKAARISSALAQLSALRFRSPDHKNESPVAFVERARELLSEADYPRQASEQLQLYHLRGAFQQSSALNTWIHRQIFPTTFLELQTVLQEYLTMHASTGRVLSDYAIPERVSAHPAPNQQAVARAAAPAAVSAPRYEQRARRPPQFYGSPVAHFVEDFEDDPDDLVIEDEHREAVSAEEIAYYTSPPPADRSAPRQIAQRPAAPPAGRGQPSRALYQPPCAFVDREDGRTCGSEQHTTSDHIGYFKVLRDRGFPKPSGKA